MDADAIFHGFNRMHYGDTLTPKESSILHLMLFYPNKKIADILNVSFETVRFHLKNIYRKTNSDRYAIRKD